MIEASVSLIKSRAATGLSSEAALRTEAVLRTATETRETFCIKSVEKKVFNLHLVNALHT